ncbi:MAG TPA: hypothetical protein V6C78_08560 [Crinalium sp.]|jgi:hypothetical protein
MLDLNPIFEFSRVHCVAICAALVPANLFATLQTLLFVGFSRPASHIQLITAFANLYALLMILHVVTWFVIGVVMIPTFVLLGLGFVCLGINGWAIAHPTSLSTFLRQLWARVSTVAELRFTTASRS